MRHFKQVTAYRKHRWELTQGQGVLILLPTQLLPHLATYSANHFGKA